MKKRLLAVLLSTILSLPSFVLVYVADNTSGKPTASVGGIGITIKPLCDTPEDTDIPPKS